MNDADYMNLVWPLCFVLVVLLIIRNVRDDVGPIFRSIAGGLSQDAGRNAKQYAIALGFGLSASLSAFWDVFSRLDPTSLGALSWHQYAALWSKIANPFIVAVLAYVTQSNFKPKDGTNPPIPIP